MMRRQDMTGIEIIVPAGKMPKEVRIRHVAEGEQKEQKKSRQEGKSFCRRVHRT
jgi:hypothetical protein